jgi:hypothetical protein
MALASQRHLVETILLSEALLSGHDLDLLANFVALLLIFVSDILLIEALLIFDLHIDRVVHQTVTTMELIFYKLTFELRSAAFCSNQVHGLWPSFLYQM